MPDSLVLKIAGQRKAEANLIAAIGNPALTATHAATCAALTELLTVHGPKLGLRSDTIIAASEPKHK